MDAFLPDIHVNGFAEKDLGTTEVLESVSQNIHVFLLDTPRAAATEVGTRVAFTPQQMREFVNVNTYWLRACNVPIRQAIILSFMKYLNVQAGLVSTNFNPDDHFVRYTETVTIPNQSIDLVPAFRPRALGEPQLDYDNALDLYNLQAVGALPAIGLRLAYGNVSVEELTNAFHLEVDNYVGDRVNNAIDFSWYSEAYPNLVCIVAFIFRTRGHHYIDLYENTYQRVYRRCGYDPTDTEISYQQLGTIATHAIYPHILDDFWARMRSLNKISGSLVKRFDSAPAGSAYVFSLRNGITDVCTVFPNIYRQHQETITKLNNEYDYLRAHRWEGCINHNYYGVPRYVVDETLFYALASIVIGVYSEFVDDSPLLQSLSLTRLSQNAPLVGAVLGTVLRTVTRDPEFAKKYIAL